MNSKKKGKTGELELAKILREHGYTDAARSQQFNGKAGDADIVGALEGIHIECKRVENLNIYNAIDQAKRDAKNGDVPTVFHRRNHKEWLVTMQMEEWLKLYGKAHDSETEKGSD